MLSSVILKGSVGKLLEENFREIIISHDVALQGYESKISLIPCLYWTRDGYNALLNLPINTKVIVRGHIESDIHIGLYVLVEYLEIQNA